MWEQHTFLQISIMNTYTLCEMGPFQKRLQARTSESSKIFNIE